MEYFKSYMEDYNTATMPHEKYYNLERWEMEDYREKQRKKQMKEAKKSHKDYDYVEEDTAPTSFNDEQLRKQELKREKERAEQAEFHSIYSKMVHDKDKRKDMRRQGELYAELQLAHKHGDVAAVRRLEKLLAPDEDTGKGVKHPWA
jgi:hypothetical protein